MYYASIGVIALLMHLIINADYLKWHDRAALEHMRVAYKRYSLFLLSIALFYIADILWGAFYAEGLILVAYADTVLFFLLMVTSVLLWVRAIVAYLGRRGPLTTAFITAGWMIFIFEVIALVINIFIPIAFEFDSEGVYHTYAGRMITLILQLVLYFATSIYAFIVAVTSESSVRKHHRTVAFSGIIMAFFIALQCLFPLMPFYSIGCMFATAIIHTFVSNDEKFEQRKVLGETKQIAYRDALTGVKSIHAYVEAREKIDRRISEGTMEELGIIVFDLNGLKHVNDTLGHEAGDKYITAGCMLICRKFTHSPVFRIGGDEFVAILEGEDYKNREVLKASFDRQMDINKQKGVVTVSSGLDIYVKGEDNDFNTIFERADKKMYERKKMMKASV